MSELTHASFFSGAGGVDLGLESAGWRTVSFSEIDPYACATLAERWPGVPNLGSIVDLADSARSLDPGSRGRGDGRGGNLGAEPGAPGGGRRLEPGSARADWQRATLWTGGFPCQDLSIAGKRRGMGEGTRSGLAFAFLDLVERYHPPAVLLENVPGLLSSNAGRDLGALLGSLGQLGYGWAYRVLDARHFGVPQRRRRVFILGLDAGIDPTGERAAEVLSVGSRCGWHPPTGVEAGPGVAAGAGLRAIGTLREHVRPGSNTDHTVIHPGPHGAAGGQAGGRQGPTPLRERQPDALDGERADAVRGAAGPSADAGRDGAADGLAGRPYHRHLLADEGVVQALDAKGGGVDDNEAQAGHLVVWTKGKRAQSVDDDESWDAGDVSPTLNAFDAGDIRATTLTLGTPGEDALLPLGLDSHRYRCCGNGVVADVAEWLGQRIAEVFADSVSVAA